MFVSLYIYIFAHKYLKLVSFITTRIKISELKQCVLVYFYKDVIDELIESFLLGNKDRHVRG